MIKTNKRRPGTINNTPVQPRSRIIRNQENSIDGRSIIARLQCCDDNVLHERNREEYVNFQNTKKKRHEEIELYLLDLSNQGISNLESQLDRNIQLQYIHTLNFNGNSIMTLPSSVFNKLVNLRELYIEQNCIEKISFPYFSQNHITRVNISKNKLVSLNLEHLESMTHLECRQNNVTFLTLPRSLRIIDCSKNKLSNIYSLQHCGSIEEINFSGNLLYDLKFNFKPYIKVKDETYDGESNQVKYKYLRNLDCSFNKIQHLEGLINIKNLKVLVLSGNKIALTRNIINQFLVLQNLEQLEVSDNPIDQGGYTEMEIVSMLCGKMTSLQLLNGEPIEDRTFDVNSQNSFNSSKKSQFSIAADEPYRLFLHSQKKKEHDFPQVPRSLQWNFTLGDCENEMNNEPRLTDLSQIEEYQTCINETQILRQNTRYESNTKVNRQQKKKELMQIPKSQQKEIKIKVVKSGSSISMPHHVHYQPFLKALLSMSYVPAYPVLNKSSRITSRRLDEEDDDFILISKMFMNRGGVVYLKKITNWIIQQDGEDLFNRHYQPKNLSQMGFLLNQLGQKEFKELCKFNKLVSRQSKDIIGMQPNVFSCFHIIVRFTPNRSDLFYNCVYLLQSTHL